MQVMEVNIMDGSIISIFSLYCIEQSKGFEERKNMNSTVIELSNKETI